MLNNNVLNKRMSIVDTAYKRVSKKKYLCFFPGCFNKAISSHSQSISTSLKSIQENGFVIVRNHHLLSLKPFPEWKEIGTKKATTFPGFCSIHDDDLFKKVDSISDKNLSSKTLAYLAFRTFALEMRKKEYYADITDQILNCDKKLFDQIRIEALDGLNGGFKNCLKVTKPYYLSFFDKLLTKGIDSPMIHKVYKIERNANVSCSTFINPVETFEQPIDKPQPIIAFNILPRQKYTLIIYSCKKKDIALMNKFICENERLEDLVFNYCEEVAMNLSFFHKLDKKILSTIDKAQAPWMMWEHKSIPDIFNIKINKNTICSTFEVN